MSRDVLSDAEKITAALWAIAEGVDAVSVSLAEIVTRLRLRDEVGTRHRPPSASVVEKL